MLTNRIKTLQQKTTIFVLIPTFLFLTAMGRGGYVFAKNSLLLQWSETAIANLQKAAHKVDMRLERPKDLLRRLNYSSGAGMAHLSFRYTIEQLRELDGVQSVTIRWPGGENPLIDHSHSSGMGMRPGALENLDISEPMYKWNRDSQTVSVYSDLVMLEGNEKGRIEVKIKVSDLVEQLAKSTWWKSNKTLVIDQGGNIIASSSYREKSVNLGGGKRFGETDILEKSTLNQIGKELFGTVFGNGHPPNEISGFYRLSEVPWYMVVVAPGETVLQPILKFRLYYSMLFAAAILLIIAFIRINTTKMTNAIHNVSIAAEDLSNGVFGAPLPVESSDEIAELTKSFNKMTTQLKQGLKLQKAMEIAKEVQQNFLPNTKYVGQGLEIYGSSRYCHETGGDFFDLLQYGNRSNKIGVVVGDVVGHGVGAALLMASVRAMLRTRSSQPGELKDIVTDVNQVLCKDTAETSNFVTLFYVTIDSSEKIIEWVRGGHDPSYVYYPDRNEFIELRGRGVALGIDGNLKYEQSSLDITAENQIIVIGSDGAWESENSFGNQFGKDRLQEIIKEHHTESPERLIDIINERIDLFLDGTEPQDDITFMVIKINGLDV